MVGPDVSAPEVNGPIARFDQVSLRYGSGPEILRQISMDLAAGSFHFLVGPSGAGKTSLLRVLYMAASPSRGRLMLFGTDIGATPRAALALLRRRIGIIFQDFGLLPQLTLFDNVALPLRIARRNEDEVRQDTMRLLAQVGLKHLAHVRPPSLSGGQQQLVAIARALIARPRLLIADEPTASVDEPLALRLVLLFEELNRMGTTVLIATHNQRLAERFAHPRLSLEGGRLTAEPAAGRTGVVARELAE